MSGLPGHPVDGGGDEPLPPVLARLLRRMRAHRGRLLRAVFLRAFAESLCLQLLLLPVLGLLSARHPYEPLWLQMLAATFALHAWPLLASARAAVRGEFRASRVAGELDRRNPDAPDVFRTLLSLENHAPDTRIALERFYAGWEKRLRMSAPGAPGRFRLRALAACLFFAAVLPLATASGRSGEAYARMLLPWKTLNEMPAPRLTVRELPAQVTQGDSLRAVVEVGHVPPARAVHVHVRHAGGEEKRYTLERDAGGSRAFFRFGGVRSDLLLRFSSMGVETPEYRVRVVPPPRLRELSVVVKHPAYTRLPPDSLPGMPAALTVLPGTRVQWNAVAETPLRSLTASFYGEDETSRAVGLRTGETFSFARTIREATELRLDLSAEPEAGGAEAPEGPWRIELKADAPPEIALLRPGEDGEMAQSLRVPILFRARDDFGVRAVRLHYGVSDGTGERSAGNVDVTARLDARDGTGEVVWDASVARPDPGDVVELRLEVDDNDTVSGPKTARSRVVRLRLPTPEEVRAAIEAGQREAVTSLESALERERRMRRESRSPDRGARGEPSTVLSELPNLQEREARRILSDQPRRHLLEVQRHLRRQMPDRREAEDRADGKADSGREREATLREFRREAAAMEERLPSPDIASAPLEEQFAALETLEGDQRELERMLREIPPPAPGAPRRDAGEEDAAREPRRKNAAVGEEAGAIERENERELEREHRRLADGLRRNQEDQENLRSWMEEKLRGEAGRRQRAERAEEHAEAMNRDMREAMEQTESMMRQALEDGTLSPDVLEKMDRVRELLGEVLEEREKARLSREAGEEPPGADEVERAMREMLDRKDGLRQSLERAVQMLEHLRDVRALGELAAETRALESRQGELAVDIAEASDAEELAARQDALRERLEETLKKMEALTERPAFQSQSRQLETEHTRRARTAMEKTSQSLRASPEDRGPSQEGADLAARQLQQAAAAMEQMLARMDAAVNRAELRVLLEETLEFTRWLGEARDPSRETAAVWGGQEAVRRSAVRTARWLRERMERMAAAAAFQGDMLRREAIALGAHAEALSVEISPEAAEGLHAHAQGAARELLKLLDQPREGGGSEEGEGAGDTDLGGGEQGQSGQEGLAGRMRGLSGRQMAVNQETQELLRSFLEQRRQSRRDQMPPSGASGSGGEGFMPGEEPDGRSLAGGEPGSDPSGKDEDGGSEAAGRGGENSGSAAAGQQTIAEALELLAESADDAGGAARRLRSLASEARALEEELRRRRVNPGEMRERQERFRARLLEAAHALEERGRERERRAEAHEGGLTAQDPPPSLPDTLARELRLRREGALRLPLAPEQRRRVEWYYEQLLTP